MSQNTSQEQTCLPIRSCFQRGLICQRQRKIETILVTGSSSEQVLVIDQEQVGRTPHGFVGQCDLIESTTEPFSNFFVRSVSVCIGVDNMDTNIDRNCFVARLSMVATADTRTWNTLFTGREHEFDP